MTVVLREPCDVEVPLRIAADFPADALGRWALTTADVVSIADGAVPFPWSADTKEKVSAMFAWLDELFPRSNARFLDAAELEGRGVAELDGAAAMWAAVPGDELHWLRLQSMATLGYSIWEDMF